jgi:hypothetical protein
MKSALKILTFYTPSHKEIFDRYFLPSFDKINKNKDFCLQVEEQSDQYVKDGIYHTHGWARTQINKIEFYKNEAIKNYGKHLIFSDADIQFFRNFKSNILKKAKNYDLVAQQSASRDDITIRGHKLCSGFFIFKAKKEVISLFEAMQNCIRIDNDNVADQICLNKNKNTVNWARLSKKYFTIGMATSGREWDSHTPRQSMAYIPKDLYLHHANFVRGLSGKMEVMDIVKGRQL